MEARTSSFPVHNNFLWNFYCLCSLFKTCFFSYKGSPLYASLLQSGSLAEELEIEKAGIETISAGNKTREFPDEKVRNQGLFWAYFIANIGHIPNWK